MDYNVLDFGADKSGKVISTKAVQKAIDTCSAEGGGRIVIPSAAKILIGTIYLKSHVTLYLEKNAVLFGSSFLRDYANDTGVCSYYPEALDRCLIYAYKQRDIALDGFGVVDGAYDEKAFTYPEDARGREAQQRPMLVRFSECEDIHIHNLKFTRSCSWCIHLQYSKNIKISDVTIDNRKQDGFNIESCEQINITNCSLHCGDDCIALTTSKKNRPLKNVTVSNCIMTTRWAALRMGPLSKGNFENITLSNCVFHDCDGGGIKLGTFEGGAIKNCAFSNIVMENCSAPILMMIDRWTDIGNPKATDERMPVGSIQDILFSNIRAIAKNSPVSESCAAKWKKTDPRNRPDQNFTIVIHGNPERDIKNIMFNTISIVFEGGGKAEHAKRKDFIDMGDFMPNEFGYWTDNKSCFGVSPSYGVFARHVEGLYFDNVQFTLENRDMRPPVYCHQCQKVSFTNFRADDLSPVI